MRTVWYGAVLLTTIALSGSCVTPRRFEPATSDTPADTACPAANVRNTERAVLCARVIDARTGVGVPGGDVTFVRKGGGSMSGPIYRDGTFSLNVPGGHGTLTIAWSCRRSVRLVDTLTIPAGRGVWRTFRVDVAPADTLCRRKREDRSDPSPGAVVRWMNRGPCFAISLGRWRPTLDASAVPPRRVQLDTAHQARGAAGSSHPLHHEPSSGAEWRFAGWRPLQGDSITLFWGTGFSGVELTLGVEGDSLAGRGIWTDDIIITDARGFRDTRGYPKGAAAARQVPCR